MTEDAPEEMPGLDPALFVGSPPAGDANPGDFVSNDQSADPTDQRPDLDQEDDQ